MKKVLIKILAVMAAGMMAASCIINIGGIGSAWVGTCTEEGIDLSDVREVGSFRALSTSLPCNVYFSQAEKQEVRVESTQEFADKVLTTVEDGKLTLRLEPGRYPKLILRVIVTAPDIQQLTVSGSGSLIQEGELRVSGDLGLKVSGSGDMQMGSLESRDLDVHCSGSGSIGVDGVRCADFDGSVSGSGTARIGRVDSDGFEASVSGSGDFFIDSLTAESDASARISGSGGIRLREVAVDGNLDLKTSGSGDITVNGSCYSVTAHCSGSGNISGHLAYNFIDVRTTGSGEVDFRGEI